MLGAKAGATRTRPTTPPLRREYRRRREQGCKEGRKNKTKKTIHHLPCSISRTVIPTSIAQYSGFFMFTGVLSVWRSVSSQGEEEEKTHSLRLSSRKKKKKILKSAFSSSPRSCWLTGGYSIHQRSSAQQSPSFGCEGRQEVRTGKPAARRGGGVTSGLLAVCFISLVGQRWPKWSLLFWKRCVNFLSRPGCIAASLRRRSAATCGGAAVHSPTEIHPWYCLFVGQLVFVYCSAQPHFKRARSANTNSFCKALMRLRWCLLMVMMMMMMIMAIKRKKKSFWRIKPLDLLHDAFLL